LVQRLLEAHYLDRVTNTMQPANYLFVFQVWDRF
jgi:hypothetical protein